MGKFGQRLHFSLETKEGITTAFILSVFIFIAVYFFYWGVTTTPQQIDERDSLDYHIPIAENIVDSGFFSPPNLQFGLGYYPAVGESILSLFIRLGIPLNVYNLLSLILLFYVCVRLGMVWGLSKHESIVYAFAITTLNSVLRLVIAQTIDIWLAVFFAWSLYMLKVENKKILHYFFLGTALGLLVGVKYSGLLYAAVLCIVFIKRLPKISVSKRFIAFLVPLVIFGFSWYIRNFLITGNPIYPGRLLNFPSHPNFQIQNWNVAKTIFMYNNGLWLFLQAIVSEYLFWALSLIAIPLVVFSAIRNKNKVTFDILSLALAGMLCFIIYIFLPSWPGVIVSDLRYIFPVMIASLLSIFLLAKKLNFVYELTLMALLSAAVVLSQLAYRPKLIFAWLVSVFFVIMTSKIKTKKA